MKIKTFGDDACLRVPRAGISTFLSTYTRWRTIRLGSADIAFRCSQPRGWSGDAHAQTRICRTNARCHSHPGRRPGETDAYGRELFRFFFRRSLKSPGIFRCWVGVSMSRFWAGKKELHVAAPRADIRVAGEGRGIERRRIKGGRSERRAEGSHISPTSQPYNRQPPKPLEVVIIHHTVAQPLSSSGPVPSCNKYRILICMCLLRTGALSDADGLGPAGEKVFRQLRPKENRNRRLGHQRSYFASRMCSTSYPIHARPVRAL